MNKYVGISPILQYADKHPIISFLKENEKELIFYGAGAFCDEMLKQAEEYALPVRFIVDRDPNKRGASMRGGIEVKCIDDIAEEIYKYKIMICINVVFSAISTLKEYGVDEKDIYFPRERICHINGFVKGFNRYHDYLSPIDMHVNKAHYLKAYELLEDDNSKAIFRTLCWYRLTGEIIDKHLLNDDLSYFNNSYAVPSKNECFVDVGAYNGDTIMEFMAKTNYNYKSIIAIEPSSKQCMRMEDLFKNYENIEIINCGVGEEEAELYLDGMQMNHNAGEKCFIHTLDTILEEKDVSIIKMDIDGMERKALNGAHRIIRERAPMLAVCIYHLTTDIWYLIEMLHQMQPKYHFVLEQPITTALSETVLYAYSC